MLIDEPEVEAVDPILAMIASVNGNHPFPRKIRDGLYEVGHFGSSSFLPDYDQHPILGETLNSYGVCDSPEQLLQEYEVLQDPEREFVVTVTPVRKSKQDPDGGWRWGKWGPYIGTQNPQHEYLYDEPEIELVYVFQIYERKNNGE